MSACRFSDYRCKEVVNICDGGRLGYVCDLEVDLDDGRIRAVYVPGPWRFFGFFGHDGWYRIPWSCVRRVGEDMLLVEADLAACRVGRPRRDRRPRV